MSNALNVPRSTVISSKPTVLAVLGLITLFCTASVGCRTTSDNQIDLLERELRVQEDYIYELEGYLVDYSEKLRDCRSCYPPQTAAYAEEVEKSKPEPRRSSKRNRTDQEERSVVEPPADEIPEAEQMPEPESFSPEDLEVPDEIDLKMDDPLSRDDSLQSPTELTVAVDSPQASSRRITIPDPLDFEPTLAEASYNETDSDDTTEPDDVFADEQLFADEMIEEAAVVLDRKVERLVVKQLFHGDGDPTAPLSLLTVVEALDANDEPVDLDGEVSLMVMTTDQQAPRRVKRWNFTADETASAWQSSELGDGLHLELPLEGQKLPSTEPLELWVRLVTADGRKLLTQLPFQPSQLRDVASTNTPIQSADATLAKSPTAAKPLNPLRPTSTSTVQEPQRVELTSSPNLVTTPTNQPRWRPASRQPISSNSGFATTSARNQGWTARSVTQTRTR